MKNKVPLFLVFFCGVVFLIQGFVPHYYSQALLLETNKWIRIVSGFALFLGIYSLTYHNVIRIRKRGAQWPFSIITLAALYFTAAVGFAASMSPEATGVQDPNFLFQKIFDNIQLPLEATMFSLLAFYIASAAARAFRARNVEATLLLITAVIVMLSKVTIGASLSPVADWILNGPNLAARRAILIGVGLGGASTSLKIMLGIERGYLGMR